ALGWYYSREASHGPAALGRAYRSPPGRPCGAPWDLSRRGFRCIIRPARNGRKQGEFDGMRRTTSAALLMAAALGLSACDNGGLRRSLGLDSRGPDEFRVVSRAPLDVPPDFGLRPPQPGASRPNEPPVRETARQTVFGANAPAAKMVAGRTVGESALLRQAGAVDLDV